MRNVSAALVRFALALVLIVGVWPFAAGASGQPKGVACTMECCRAAATRCGGNMSTGQCGCQMAPQPRVAITPPQALVFVPVASSMRVVAVEAPASLAYYRRSFNWSGDIIPSSTRAGPDIGRAPPLS